MPPEEVIRHIENSCKIDVRQVESSYKINDRIFQLAFADDDGSDFIEPAFGPEVVAVSAIAPAVVRADEAAVAAPDRPSLKRKARRAEAKRSR